MSLNLCRIETEGQPIYADPALIAFVVPSDGGVELCDRYGGKYVPIKTKLTTTQVVDLLGAHEAKQAEASAGPGDYVADAKMLAAALNRLADERGTDREAILCSDVASLKTHNALQADELDQLTRRVAILITGLRRMVDLSDDMDGLGWHPFLRRLLEHAGVTVEEHK